MLSNLYLRLFGDKRLKNVITYIAFDDLFNNCHVTMKNI